MTRSDKHAQVEREYPKLVDDMWVAIDQKVPLNKWIPFTSNKDVAVDIICMFIDLDCYKKPYSLELNSDYTAFRKINREISWKSSKIEKTDKKNGNGCHIKCELKG